MTKLSFCDTVAQGLSEKEIKREIVIYLPREVPPPSKSPHQQQTAWAKMTIRIKYFTSRGSCVPSKRL